MKSIMIKTPRGIRKIGQGNPVFIIAEMSCNHGQSFLKAKKIIDEAAKAGVDAVKLQTFKPENITLDCDEKLFQIKVNDAWKGQTLYNLYKNIALPWEWHKKLIEYGKFRGVLVFSTPFDEQAVDFLENLNVPFYKIASFELIDIPLVRKIAKTKKPVIISRGMASLSEIKLAIKILKQNGCPQIILLHCVSAYPAKPEEMNLATIKDLSKRFKVTVGLSDHSLGINAAIASVAMGATVIEKHFILDRKQGGADAAFSIEPAEMKLLVTAVREVEKLIGKPTYIAKGGEKENVVFRRSLFAVKDIVKGEEFSSNNVRSIRPGNGLAPKYYDNILGRVAKVDIKVGTPLKWSLISKQKIGYKKILQYKISSLFFDAGVYVKRNVKFPSILPFVLQYNQKINLITQRLTSQIKKCLKIYYEAGGYGSTPLGEGEYATKQGQEIFNAIKQCLKENGKKLSELKFLEIGCSYGYLLYLIKKAGAKEVLGVEPGEEGIEGSKKYGIELIKDFFPTNKLNRSFDFIYSHAVLEHIDNPLKILKDIYKKLASNGLIFIAVPDCEKKMEVGDISIISHQHVNYFTKNSLSYLLTQAGFANNKVVSSEKRSILYAWGVKNKKKTDKSIFKNEYSDRKIFLKFKSSLQKNIVEIQRLVKGFESQGKSIGLYAPSSNLRGMIKYKKDPRIFNIDQVKHGKFINGCKNSFESPNNLVNFPVDVLLVEPIDYDREIREYLNGLELKKMKIISLKEIYEKNSGVKYTPGSVNYKKTKKI